jgi:hypothetical protein
LGVGRIRTFKAVFVVVIVVAAENFLKYTCEAIASGPEAPLPFEIIQTPDERVGQFNTDPPPLVGLRFCHSSQTLQDKLIDLACAEATLL